MKIRIKNLLIQSVLITGFGLMIAGRVTAQTFSNLYSFAAGNVDPSSNYTNSDGTHPGAGLMLLGDTLYGTARQGGSSGNGTVFAVKTDGTGFTNLHRFMAGNYDPSSNYTNSDGANPSAGLSLSGNTLYGTAFAGGISGNGTVFAINTDSSGFTNYSFSVTPGFPPTNGEGAMPYGGLILSGGTLYGTATRGGSSGYGTIFKINIDGTDFTNLYSFTALVHDEVSSAYTNSDGAYPKVGLILSGNTLYGTAGGGGSSGNGTLFVINTDGTGFTNLHTFAKGNFFTNSDGANPAGLILSGNTLYGTANALGSGGAGTVFAVHTDGTGFTNLYSFTNGIDGAYPQFGPLVLSGGTLYGTASSGGSSGKGTVFAVNTNGMGFTNLYSFTTGNYDASSNYTNEDGTSPNGGLILSGNTLYGTASYGGSSGNGTVFSISLPVPQNQPPVVANPIPDQSNSYGNAFNYIFPANTFSDPDLGQTLTYTASNLPPGLTFDGSTRTFIGTNTDVGTYSVVLTATDDGSPALSTNDTFNIVVGKALLTVRALDRTNAYGDFIFLSPYSDIEFTGFVSPDDNVFTLDQSDYPQILTTATNGSPVGIYPITVSGGSDPHYQYASYQGGTLTLTKASLSVLVDSYFRPVGGTNPPFTATITGIQNSDNITAALSTSATPASPLGDYPITVSLQDPDNKLPNYLVNVATGMLSVVNFTVNYQIIHSFGYTNLMGSSPYGLIQASDGLLYGGVDKGTFRINTNGSGYGVLSPYGAVIEGRDGFFYGINPTGGSNGLGMVFKISKDGTGFEILHHFAGGPSDGSSPGVHLVQGANGLLYGGTSFGGLNGYGTVFQIDTNGAGYAVLHNFAFSTDGAGPTSLIEGSDGVLYGTTRYGGVFDSGFGNGGTVFSLNENDGSCAALHSFQGANTFIEITPKGLIEDSDGTLYGVTAQDGAGGVGTVFKLQKNGSGYLVMHTFTLTADGHTPSSLLSDSNGTIYGITLRGSSTSANSAFDGFGTLFKINTNGTGYSLLASFGFTNGANPNSLLRGADGFFYGTCSSGGNVGDGTLFRVSTNGTDLAAVRFFNKTGGDGEEATAAPIQGTDGALYGVTELGGSPGLGASSGVGVIYRVTTDGSDYQIIHNFSGTNGDDGFSTTRLYAGSGGWLYGFVNSTLFKVRTNGNSYTVLSPASSVIEGVDGNLYGVQGGNVGSFFEGTVFKVATDGNGLTVLYNFGADPGDGFGGPVSLIQGRDGLLYGTTSGGLFASGTIFRISTNGSGYSILHQFGASDGVYYPIGGLLNDTNGVLYGATYSGGVAGMGAVFRLDTNGGNFQILHSFLGTPADGAHPMGPLAEAADGTLIGTTTGDQFAAQSSTLFRLAKDGSGYCVLQVFGNFVDGPLDTGGAIVGSDGSIYGATQFGGDSNLGAVFKVTLAPVLFNQPPTLNVSIPDQPGSYGSTFSYTIPVNTFSDPDAGQVLSYAASNLPPGITFDGATRTFSGTNTTVGIYPVTVTVTDNGSPPLSTNDVFNIAVGKATLTARPNDQTNSYGASVFINAYLDVAYSGFKFPGESAFSLQSLPNPHTTATASSPVGIYSITLSGGSDPHYSYVFQSGQLTLTNAPLTVVIYNAFRVAGRTNPPLSGRFVGLLNSDPITLAFSTTATPASAVGDYPISVTLTDPNHRLTNYTVSTVQGALTIIPYDFVYGMIHSFWTTNETGQVDVAYSPGAAVIEGRDGVLYGIAMHANNNQNTLGAIFRVNKDGTGYRVLTNLTATSDNGFTTPAPLVQGTNGMLYGTAPGGGTVTPGNIFRINTNGAGFTVMHTFSESEGSAPNGPLLLSTNGLFYGSSGNGADTVYRIQQDGLGFAVIWQGQGCCNLVTNEPNHLQAGLIEGRDGALYGVSTGGFGGSVPTVFKLQKDGSGMTILHNFDDGASPLASLTEDSGGVLYGTTYSGGGFGDGTVFSLHEDGSNFKILHQFDYLGGDGSSPYGSLLEGKDGFLYGTTWDKVVYDGFNAHIFFGTVFRLAKDGTEYCVLHNSGNGPTNSGYLTSALIQGSDGIFYGTAQSGGALNVGAVFRLFELVPPALNINPAGLGNITVSWQPPTPGFVLQQSDSLMLGWTNTPGGTSNPISLPRNSAARFYRLHLP